MNSRRGFLRLLGVGAAVALDPERALWLPGKLISIPAPVIAKPRYKIGFTINVRRPPRFIARSGLHYRPESLFEQQGVIIVKNPKDISDLNNYIISAQDIADRYAAMFGDHYESYES